MDIDSVSASSPVFTDLSGARTCCRALTCPSAKSTTWIWSLSLLPVLYSLTCPEPGHAAVLWHVPLPSPLHEHSLGLPSRLWSKNSNWVGSVKLTKWVVKLVYTDHILVHCMTILNSDLSIWSILVYLVVIAIDWYLFAASYCDLKT